MKIFIIMATVALASTLSLSARSETIERPDVRTSENKVVYSVYLRNYTNPESSATFNDLRRDLPRIKGLGIDVIHLLPFYEMGVEHAKGSPYCIRNYRAVDSRYGTMDDLRDLVNELHANGMQIWQDWVGNHTAYDHPWVKQHPDWYTERQDFDDVRSINSSNKELRKAMAEEMRFWVDELGIDGFRCDFAHAPGREFWVDIINMVDPDHKLYWLAEGDEGGIASDWIRNEGGPFDSRYGWSYSEFLYKDEYDRKNATDRGDFNKAMFHLGYPADRATFLTYIGSHDIFQGMKPQVSPNTQDMIYGDNLIPFTVMTMLAPGIPMVYMGQDINYSKPGGISIMTDTEAIDWNKVDKNYQALITELIHLRHSEPALQTLNGKLLNHTTDNDSVYVFERRNGKHSVVAMINFSYNPQEFHITSKIIPENTYYNKENGKTVSPSHDALRLPGKGYAIFTKDDADLKTDTYTVSVTVSDRKYHSGNPLLSVFTPDPLEKSGDIYVVNRQSMIPVAGKDHTFTTEIEYLPEFGYILQIESDSSDSKPISLNVNKLDNLSFELKEGQLIHKVK